MRKIELPIKEIVEKYENGTNPKDLAIEYGTSISVINNRLKEYYEKSGKERPFLKGGKKKRELPIKEIVEKYENGISTRDLGIEYGITSVTIDRRLNEYYKNSGKKVPRILKSMTVIEEYLKKGMSIEEIVEIASNRNIIIPKALVDKVLNNKNIADEER